MVIYDGISDIDWFYGSVMTASEMRADRKFAKLFSSPCVLYDNGDGKVYGFDTVADIAARYAVPSNGDPNAVLHNIESVIAGTYRAPGVAEVEQKADDAQATADEAKEIASQAGTDPQVMAFARMVVIPMAETMTISEGASVSTLWPERKVGDTVKLKDFFWYAGELYRCNQPELTITEGQTPDMNLPALYGHVSVAPDGILIWDGDDLTGAPDIYNTGVKVHYPDADGPIYISQRDGNTSTPGTDQWWTLDE